MNFSINCCVWRKYFTNCTLTVCLLIWSPAHLSKRPPFLLTMNHMHILVSTTHCSIQRTLEFGPLLSSIGTSQNLKRLKNLLEWGRRTVIRRYRTFLCHIGFKVCCFHLTLNYDYFMSWPCISEISQLDYYFPCRLLTGYSNLKRFLSNDLPLAVKVSWMDLYCEIYDGRQGLEMWPPQLEVILMQTDGFETPIE